MTSMFDNALAAGLVAVKTVSGVTVTYTTPAGSVSVTAVRAQQRVETVNNEGAAVSTVHRNYLIDAADLEIADALVVPDLGHKITDTGHVYEVIPEVTGDRPWRWSDRGFTRYRIQTREVAA